MDCLYILAVRGSERQDVRFLYVSEIVDDLGSYRKALEEGCTKAAEKLAQTCGATIVVRANCTGGADGMDDYVSMLDSVLTGLRDAFGRK